MGGQPEKIDILYTWVDDTWPGYWENLNRFAETKFDTSRNRTRDNLEIMKYSLRSLERNAPWMGNLVFVTQRPQIPTWLDTDRPDVTIVHHDDFIPDSYLPTFNSFAITSFFDRLEMLPNRFVYFEDDFLLWNKSSLDHFVDPDGTILIRASFGQSPDAEKRHDGTLSPYTRSVAECNHLLDERYGKAVRGQIDHTPVLTDRRIWAEMKETWPDAFERTQSSKFRAPGNVTPDHLYLYFMLANGYGRKLSDAEVKQVAHYWPVENIDIWNIYQMYRVRRSKAVFLAMNDNFGVNPHPRVVDRIRRFLEASFPTPSRFEKP